MICAQCNRRISEEAKSCIYCRYAFEPQGISEWLSQGQRAWMVIAVSIAAGLIATVLPDIPSLVFGVLALSGFLLVVNHVAPRMLRGSWGQLGLAFLAIGLATYVSGWFVAEQFYDAGVNMLNLFTDPVHREFWRDPDILGAAQQYLLGGTRYELGQEFLQDAGTIIAFCGFAILGIGTVLTMARPGETAGPDGTE